MGELAVQAFNTLITAFSLYPADILPYVVNALPYTLISTVFVGPMPTGLLNDSSWARLVMLVSVTAGFTLTVQRVFQ
ncbi:MAG: hypothetical protein GY832_24150 [Chloroflexi bacterium]|nr:hypothetical protein [Chloroflexota bacterium]